MNVTINYGLSQSLREEKIKFLTRMIYVLAGVSIFLLICLFLAYYVSRKRNSRKGKVMAKDSLDDSHLAWLNNRNVHNIHNSRTNIIVKNLHASISAGISDELNRQKLIQGSAVKA